MSGLENGHGGREPRRGVRERLANLRHRRLNAVHSELYWLFKNGYDELRARLDAERRPGHADHAPRAEALEAIQEAVERTGAELRSELDLVRAAIPAVTLGSQPRFSPPLWNDLGRPPLDALPPIGRHLGADAAEELRAAAEHALATPSVERLAALGWDRVAELAAQDDAPLPAGPDRERYFDDRHAAYWLSGLADVLMILEARRRHARVSGDGTPRLLDFGCSSGRVLRHVRHLAPEMAGFGVDIGTTAIEWARRHLPPSLTVIQGTILPHLPFADGSLDVVFAGSVFTHIADFEEAWLLEIARVLRPGGVAVLTIHPERTWSDMRDPDHLLTTIVTGAPHRVEPLGVEPVTADLFDRPMPADRVVFVLTTYPVNNTNVLHSARWIDERWGRHFEIAERLVRAHGDHQDALVLRKPG